MLNCRLDLDLEISAALSKTDDDIRGEHLNRHFPSSVVELTSCEQFNIKFNEIFEYRVNQILLESPGNTTHIHKHDYLNETQSPDIVFSIAMCIAVLLELDSQLYVAMRKLHNAFEKYEELSIYAHQVTVGIQRLKTCEPRLLELPVNDMVMSTGIKTPETGLTFVDVSNKFEDFNTYNIMTELSSTLNPLTVSLMKIANDIHMLHSIIINETQYKAMAMAAAQIMGNHMAVTVVNTRGHLELNLLKPLIIKNVLFSFKMLNNVCDNFSKWSPLERQAVPNGTRLLSTTESCLVPYVAETGQAQSVFLDATPSSPKQHLFDNAGRIQSIASVTAMFNNPNGIPTSQFLSSFSFCVFTLENVLETSALTPIPTLEKMVEDVEP
ncbi:unnamed protein product, partial [Rotaria magnacalcarata]